MPDEDEPAATAAEPAPRRRLVTWLRRIGVAAAAVFVAIQFVPYGWQHSNPPVVQDAPWPDSASAAIAHESCYACHSNETDWPWYSYVAPMSWLVRRDVDQGRDELNFSRWDRSSDKTDDAIEMIVEGAMPPSQYTLIHRGAELTDEEVAIMVAALEAMDDDDNDSGGSDGGNSGPGGGDDD